MLIREVGTRSEWVEVPTKNTSSLSSFFVSALSFPSSHYDVLGFMFTRTCMKDKQSSNGWRVVCIELRGILSAFPFMLPSRADGSK
jgi:hypothetical protein